MLLSTAVCSNLLTKLTNIQILQLDRIIKSNTRLIINKCKLIDALFHR